MNKIKNVLFYLVIIEALLISILMTISITRLYKRCSDLEMQNSILGERLTNIAISNRLNYEDILEIIERK